MPRANRYIIAGLSYHLTHRCHNRDFLLRFAKDRDCYRQRLRDALKDFDVLLLNYAITSNHVHLMASAADTEQLSGLMQMVAGQSAQAYNRRKHRHGAFWEDRFHATMIEDGNHLWQCSKYIDLNMVRASAVKHPQEWEWCGYRELMGRRERYRVLALDALLEKLGAGSAEEFRANYLASINESLARRDLRRDPKWTECVAVGSKAYVDRLRPSIRRRGELEAVSEDPSAGATWVLREVAPPPWRCVGRTEGSAPADRDHLLHPPSTSLAAVFGLENEL